VSALEIRITRAIHGTRGAPPFTLDVDIAVPPGVTVLFGPSGSGKTTVLQAIAGIGRPDRGRIALGDDVWFDGTIDRPIHERRVAYVFQSLALFPHMTAEANVMYGLAGAPDTRHARARALLDRMHVAHLAERKPRTFSGGEAQRVALARAFAMTPRCLLLDEPFSALDEKTKARLLADVAEWVAREKLPTLLVTHAREEASSIGERVLFLDGGRIARESAIGAAFEDVAKASAVK
jgi:molybdate transport system ATP-binding protein